MPLPLVTIVRGRPTAEELAAVIAVFQARAAAPPPPARPLAEPRRSAWNDRASAIEMRRLPGMFRSTRRHA
ncbi:predicted protein [Streptomyces viridochromogenes DSM 40736]|uniref:Predicted protein n=1 Tax=Streptomyces viridochromogenes (strain DSM 40736 / JCM 4977 / BCRC 1201 / Tue 494) TaxID=591159 RepID=D9X434_STRVT|nr:acyl-CoA carboxylase subunit epsilon [Streptomyces viridochromogenes]EFL35862.1 predicted protein [Streptomyces viridochromogenes DSM 40736]